MSILQVSLTTKTILIIKESSNMADIVQACLNDLIGWDVLIAEPNLQGLQQATIYQPDAIILIISLNKIDEFIFLVEGMQEKNINMYDAIISALYITSLDEFNFLENLKLQSETKKIPVVLLTTKPKCINLQYFQRYQQVVGVIANPSDPVLLPHLLASLLGWDLGFPADL